MNFKIETHMSDSNLKTNEVVMITKADFMSIVEDAVKERIQMTLLSSKAEPERQEERYIYSPVPPCMETGRAAASVCKCQATLSCDGGDQGKIR